MKFLTAIKTNLLVTITNSSRDAVSSSIKFVCLRVLVICIFYQFGCILILAAYQGKFGIPVSWEEKERGVVIYMEFPR